MESVALLLAQTPETWFGAEAVSRFYPTRDELGRPAVGFDTVIVNVSAVPSSTGSTLLVIIKSKVGVASTTSTAQRERSLPKVTFSLPRLD